MNTQDILNKLNIDTGNPEALNGALDAINALKKGDQPWPPPPPPPPTDPPLPGPPEPGPDLDDMDEDDRAEQSSNNQPGKTDPLDKPSLRIIKHRRTLKAARDQLAKAKEAGVSQDKIDALEQAIAEMEMLSESSGRSIQDLSDEEFDSMINKTVTAIINLGIPSGIKVDSDEIHKDKVKAFNDKITDEKTIFELEQEDNIPVSKEHEQELIQQQNAARNQRMQDLPTYRSSDSFEGFDAFLESLQAALATQIKYITKKLDTWTAINRRYSSTGVLRQGQKYMRIPAEHRPVIDFYFDYSGSWGREDIKTGHKALDAISQLEKDGLITVNVYYFGGNVVSDPSAVYRGSTTAWNDIIKTIKTTEATNVVIMTDSDMEYLSKKLKHTVPGYVWYLWKRGSNAQSLPASLRGDEGTEQYSFNS